jgi:hypothetical protein
MTGTTRGVLFAYFVANHTANDGTTDGSGSAAAGQNSSADRADSSANGRVLALSRHAAAGP